MKRLTTRAINITTGLLGIVLFLISLLIEPNTAVMVAFLSIGCSLVATSIASFISSSYIIGFNEKSVIIDDYRLEKIYDTKAIMNETSNKYLDKAINNIDIIATGMSNFINTKGRVLVQKAQDGVVIRIISCGSGEMLGQREKDESEFFDAVAPFKMQKDVVDLSKWVNSLSGYDVAIKYMNTYPGFSYLRIDDHVFFGPNLPKRLSQQNCVAEFDIFGKGGQYFSKYFDELWNSTTGICTDSPSFSESEERNEPSN